MAFAGATSLSRRSSLLKPTAVNAILAETLPDYEVLSWGGVVAPAGAPADVVTRLSSELTEIGKRQAVQQRFAGLGAHLQVSSPARMESFIRSQMERWRKVIAQTGIALD